MALEHQTSTDSSVTQLVSGIVSDAQDLFKQQITLLRHEVQEDVQNAKEALASLAGGLVISLLGGVLLALMLVELLHWLLPNLPHWSCFALVGIPICAIGAILAREGYNKLKLSKLVPEQSAQALKENVRWLANPK